MQDLRSIVGAGLFGGAVERRLRPLTHHYNQSLKCPRCESTNTKFCYYNNYNLLQPRHFCKSCRRYWTKGGVLRNVPVGGGCRKNKHSKAKKYSPGQASASAAMGEASIRKDAANSPLEKLTQRKSSSNSSSENSSLTAAATATSTATPAIMIAESVSDQAARAASSYKSLAIHTAEPNQDGRCIHALPGNGTEAVAFSEVRNYPGLITGSREPIACGLELGSALLSQPSQDTSQQLQWENQDQSQTLGIGGIFDQTINVDLAGMDCTPSGGAFVPSDWEVKDGASDLPTTLDQAYWSQGQIQWTYQGQNPEPLPPVNFSQFFF
ncbi:hypothetical protein SAY86_025129 [Trapa natans]|uniref:Dof zinc finger protein n=1 Tax=Trapa natans TaxID=22666 RepID=A0AAN7M6K4_TRANT|nr:hypothetical protein SAY86_025129 [Trapa natans]